MDTEFGPFEDMQFDVVVDVETTSLEKEKQQEKGAKFTIYLFLEAQRC